MTTIATDGITIASDSLRCAGSERIDVSSKKLLVKGGHVFAFCGDFAAFDPAVAWYLAGRDPALAPKAHKDGSWRLLVIDRDGLRGLTSELPYPEPFPYPQAFGSGQNWALAAMRFGKTASEAIAFASEMDVYTAGPIQVVNIAEALGLAPVREAAE